jgi:peptide methionine sulfoxide reductase msrA/msrB
MDDFKSVCEYIDFRRKDYERPIVVEVLKLRNYYTAEDYHQNYLNDRPFGYCHVNLCLAMKPLSAEEMPVLSEEEDA